MGWKAVRDHYRIDHDVQVTSAGICIGSPYIHDIIVISVDRGEIVRRWGEPHSGKLGRYLEEMDADPVKLAELVAADDVFERSIPVYTYEGGDIIEKQCEALGYPNVTHDGCMQYENTFSSDPDLVLTWAIASAQAGVKWMRDALIETEKMRAEQSHRLAQREEDLRRLTERDRRPSA
ncbi:hypothetical protein [Sphingobium yanoikuyae]|uniref:hypothetical protein n=1 Tax=Sphingobium yanoikuyae TaxID=13690 RepID=UPI0004E3F4FA|nr:hypothetical protein [Sphingobium yanoikuyae]KFD27046.1 hypothetical protein IH86_16760 [Sphingobium yanoikuyae]MDV3479911.1 hypothetical protein [Sphingobium yanoikuyae]